MSTHLKNLTFLLSPLFLLLSNPLFAQSYEIPERPALNIAAQIPKNISELSVAFAKGATSKSCTTGKNPTCVCLSYKNIHIRRWNPNLVSGISYTDSNFSFFIEHYNPNLKSYSGFWNISPQGWRAEFFGSSLKGIRFGKVSKPDVCSEDVPKFEEAASALEANWSNIDQRWRINGFQQKGSNHRRDFSEDQQAGVLAPTLFIGEDNYEIQGGYYLPFLRSQIMASLSTKRVGAGLGIVTRRPFSKDLSQLELGGRLDYKTTTLSPFLHGNAFFGSDRVHLSGSFDIDKDQVSRPLVGRRLFQSSQRSQVGILLSGDNHHLRFSGMQTIDPLKKQEISAEYTSRYFLEETELDTHLRYQALELESDKPLQTTTLALRLSHRFGHPGLYLKPSIQLTNNFSTIPIDKGFDASTTGFMMGQISSGMRFIGRFPDLSHIVDFQILGGRDLFGFQQRAIRDGGSPFTFQRQPGLTYAWAGIENSFLAEVWNIEIPVGVLVDNIGGDFDLTPLVRFKFSADKLKMNVETMCSEACGELVFRASADADFLEYGWGEGTLYLSLHYGFGNYGTADFMRARIQENGHQMFNYQSVANADSSYIHSTHVKLRFDSFAIGIEGYLSDNLEGLLGTLRLDESLGWSVDSRMGWSSEIGFSAQLGFSANSRFFAP